MTNLGTLGGTYGYSYGRAINDSGLIVGYGTHTSGNLRAFSLQLVAVPEPSTYALIGGAGPGGVAAWRRRA